MAEENQIRNHPRRDLHHNHPLWTPTPATAALTRRAREVVQPEIISLPDLRDAVARGVGRALAHSQVLPLDAVVVDQIALLTPGRLAASSHTARTTRKASPNPDTPRVPANDLIR